MIALLALGIGIAAGMVLTYLISGERRQARDLRRELDRVNDDYAAYRKDVTEHFADTATAVNRLTESYREVHEQLRRSARRLCDNAAAETALALDQAKLIGADEGGDRPAGPAGTLDEGPLPPAADPDAVTAAADDAASPEKAGATAKDPADRTGPDASQPDAEAAPAPPSPAEQPPRDYADERGPAAR